MCRRDRIARLCPNNKEAIIWYEECMLRYSDRSFFSTLQKHPNTGILYSPNIKVPNTEKRVLENTLRLNDVVEEAAKSKFAVKEANLSTYNNATLYTLAQCMPDLSTQDCHNCLRHIILEMGFSNSSTLYTLAQCMPDLLYSSSQRTRVLNWVERYKIIVGIAQGILYLHVWKQWSGGNWSELLDSNMIELESYSEVMIRCIQIGLLCVQENPDVRTSMNTVVQYLSNDSIQLPFPQEPAFVLHGRRMESTNPKGIESRSGKHAANDSEPCSINEISLKTWPGSSKQKLSLSFQYSDVEVVHALVSRPI
ncbi:cysteine-rich receptor-like protein kinase 10 [Senna tora]|uniref:Cysteine-rich receptor-like protein kinase 10 n=1 Tax=Senna tora TaxID=362788 RepID=A0A834XAC2_9FABA|nr:cysteine-rich receptor-like protein kinase 10 [Senna tora]